MYFAGMKKILSKIGLDPFVLGILVMVVLGYLFPQLALIHEPFSLATVTDFGVGFIFFFYGLKLPISVIKSDLSNWKLHLSIQLIVFLIFPCIVLLFYPFFKDSVAYIWWVAFFFLATLPSTVSSSVVMVSMANGNVPSAIFNASISSLLGVFFTPLWMGLFLEEQNGSMDLSAILFKLVLQVLVPVLLGLMLNKRLGFIAQRNKENLKLFDQFIILLIVYNAFSHSFNDNLFSGMSCTEIVVVTLVTIALFFLVMLVSTIISRWLKLQRPEHITLLFCGSKKSLVHGTVMSKVLFTNPQMAGIMLLPIMIYHASQLIIVSFIAKKMAKRD